MTLIEILTSVKANHARVTQAGVDTKDAVARVGVKLAIQELPKFHEFEVLRTSTDIPIAAEAGNVDVPDGILKLLEVRYMNDLLSYTLPIKNREWVTRRYPDLDALSSSYPIHCYQEGSKIYVAPRSAFDVSLRLQYTTLPSFDATDDGSSLSPAIPLIDRYLISYATSWVFKSLQLFNEAGQWMADAVNELQAAMAFDLRKPGEDRRIDGFSPFERKIMDPTDPFNFEPNSSQMEWW